VHCAQRIESVFDRLDKVESPVRLQFRVNDLGAPRHLIGRNRDSCFGLGLRCMERVCRCVNAAHQTLRRASSGL